MGEDKKPEMVGQGKECQAGDPQNWDDGLMLSFFLLSTV